MVASRPSSPPVTAVVWAAGLFAVINPGDVVVTVPVAGIVRQVLVEPAAALTQCLRMRAHPLHIHEVGHATHQAVFHLQLDLARLLFSGDVASVIIPGTEGEMTILPQHAPVQIGRAHV
mgnify:CR=1 FL=1